MNTEKKKKEGVNTEGTGKRTRGRQTGRASRLGERKCRGGMGESCKKSVPTLKKNNRATNKDKSTQTTLLYGKPRGIPKKNRKTGRQSVGGKKGGSGRPGKKVLPVISAYVPYDHGSLERTENRGRARGGRAEERESQPRAEGGTNRVCFPSAVVKTKKIRGCKGNPKEGGGTSIRGEGVRLKNVEKSWQKCKGANERDR